MKSDYNQNRSFDESQLIENRSKIISRAAVGSALQRLDDQFIEVTKLDIISTKELPFDSGVNKKWKLTYANGVSVLFKPGVQFGVPYQKWPERSFVAFKIDRLLELYLVPPTQIINANVGRGLERGSAMLWIDQAILPPDLQLTNADRPDEMKLLDAIIGNRDRKDSDWLIGKDGVVNAIDNDSTFRHFDMVRGSDKLVWEYEISAIQSAAKRSEFLERTRAAHLDSINTELDMLDRDEQDRFRETYPLIVQFLARS